MDNEIYEIFGYENKHKVDFLLKIVRKDYVKKLSSQTGFVRESIDLNLDEFYDVKEELPDNLKLFFEEDFRGTISILRKNSTESKGLHYGTKWMCLIGKYLESNVLVENELNSNLEYRTFIETGIITKEELRILLESNLDVDRINLGKIDSKVNEILKNKLLDSKSDINELLDNVESVDSKDKFRKVLNIFSKTNELYKNPKIIKSLVEKIDNENYELIENVLEDPNLLFKLASSTDFFGEEITKHIEEDKKLDLAEIERILEEKNNENETRFTISAKKVVEVYKKYGTLISDVKNLSPEILKFLSKEKFDEVLGQNVDVIDIVKLANEAIYSDVDISQETKEKMKSYLSNLIRDDENLNIYNLDEVDVKILRENSETLARDENVLATFYYIKNIKGDDELSKYYDELDNEEIKTSIQKVNRFSKPYELKRLFEVIKGKVENNSIDEKTSKFKGVLLSSLSKEKREELEEVVKQMDFNEFNYDMKLPQNMTFGVELEFENLSETTLKAISKEDSLLLSFLSKQEIEVLNGWDIKRDGSVKTGSEVVSPILKDNSKDWEALKLVCDTVNLLGANKHENCGGHIHIGANIFDNNTKGFKTFLKLWESSEEYIYKMCNKEGEKLRERVGEFATPTRNIINHLLENSSLESEEDIISLAREYGSYTNELLENNQYERYKGLNLHPISSGKQNTIEFRLPNGETNPSEIQKNIKLFASVITTAKKISDDPEYKKDLVEKLNSKEIDKEDKLYVFADLIFEDRKDQAIYLSRYFNYPDELKIENIEYDKFVETKPEKIKKREDR